MTHRMKHPALDAVIEVQLSQVPIYVQSGWISLNDEENAEIDKQDAPLPVEPAPSDSVSVAKSSSAPTEVVQGAAPGAADNK